MTTKNIYQFMQELDIEGVATGVDALTVTATGLEGKLSIAAILHELSDVLAVEQEKKFNFQGAQGWARGPIRYASKIRENLGVLWSILMITGGCSESALRVALKMGDLKFTRIDVCVDIALRERVLQLPRKLKDSYKGKRKIKMIESLTGDTLYVGSRESEAMLRIYDKSEEYGRELGYVWRYEVEFKGRRAEPVALYIGTQGLGVLSDLVFMVVRSMSLPSPILGNVIDVRGSRVTLSSNERKLDWLSRQVKGVVNHLVKVGYSPEVYEQLGLVMIADGRGSE